MNHTIDVTTRRSTSSPFSSANTRDALMMVVDSTLIAYCVIVIIIAMVMGYQLYQDRLNRKIVTVENYPERTVEELKKAHAYHGIKFSEQGVDGDWFFVRDGKRCKLFAYLNNQHRREQ